MAPSIVFGLLAFATVFIQTCDSFLFFLANREVWRELMGGVSVCLLVLFMTVNPGFGGQSFIKATCAKVRRLRERARQQALVLDIEVDGGINVDTVAERKKQTGRAFDDLTKYLSLVAFVALLLG